jgi:hypothetical protein
MVMSQGGQAEGVQAEVFGSSTFGLQAEPLQPLYLSSYVNPRYSETTEVSSSKASTKQNGKRPSASLLRLCCFFPPSFTL